MRSSPRYAPDAGKWSASGGYNRHLMADPLPRSGFLLSAEARPAPRMAESDPTRQSWITYDKGREQKPPRRCLRPELLATYKGVLAPLLALNPSSGARFRVSPRRPGSVARDGGSQVPLGTDPGPGWGCRRSGFTTQTEWRRPLGRDGLGRSSWCGSSWHSSPMKATFTAR